MGCGASSEDFGENVKAAEKIAAKDPKVVQPEHIDAMNRIARHANYRVVPSADRLYASGSAVFDNGDPDALTTAHLVQQSWERTLETVTEEAFGDRILEILFERVPEAKMYFAGVPLERQGVAIARMIAQVVRVESQAAAVVPTLLSLGARHALYGFEPKMLSEMRYAAMEALDEVHAPEGGLPQDELNAWNGVWRIVLDLMTHGMEGPAGVANRERYEAQAAQQVKSAWDAIRVKQVEGGEEFRLFSRLMYKNIIQQRPELKRFSNLTDFRTADRIMVMLTGAIEDRAAGRDPSPTLRECGHRHIAYEVSPDLMRVFLPPFLYTIEMYIGEEAFTQQLRHHFTKFWEYLVDTMASGMVTDDDGGGADRAPRQGPFAIAFTDIEKSTRLWETYPGLMQQALDKHNRILRQLIQQHGGYEVKTIGDSFMVAFPSMSAAAVFACAVQTELMLQAPIAPGFKMVRPTQGGGPDAAWDDTTLRVRVGIEWCTEASPQYDAVHRRMDYFGPSVNVAARVEGAAGGGQVLVTGGALAQLQAEQAEKPTTTPFEFLNLSMSNASFDSKATPPLLNDALGVRLAAKGAELKGVALPVDLYTVLPVCLKQRTFEVATRVNNSALLSANAGSVQGTPLHGHRQPSARSNMSRRSSFSSARRSSVGPNESSTSMPKLIGQPEG